MEKKGDVMQTNTKKHITAFLHYLLILAIVIAMIPAVPGEAASQKSKALSAYKKMLNKSTVTVLPKGKKVTDWNNYKAVKYQGTKAKYVKFCIAYIDSDSVPELILADTNQLYYGLWTYKSGKVKCLYYDDNGAPVGYYKKKWIFRGESYSEGSIYYMEWFKISGVKVKSVITVVQNEVDEWGEFTEYYVGDKEVSRSTYKKKLKSYTGGKAMTKLVMRTDTSANRKKYLK